jgi:predicted metal-dependent phosphoesterase TrpH
MMDTFSPPITASSRIDLHIHTSLSDGRYDPEDVLRRCAIGGLDLVALTDHDMTSCLQPGVHEIEGRSLRLLAGAEVSGTHQGVEYHLLVYFPGTVPKAFRTFCEARCRHRAQRYESMRLATALPHLQPAHDAAKQGECALTRLHLAQDLVRRGHVSSLQEAFDRYLGSHLENVPLVDLTYIEAIKIARTHGGLTSWAHPKLAEVQQHILEFKEAGLQGIEAVRPGLRASQQRSLRRLARKHGLFVTGGSDWHGWHPGPIGAFSVQPQQVSSFLEAVSNV